MTELESHKKRSKTEDRQMLTGIALLILLAFSAAFLILAGIFI
jgi:hypothetical protein